MSSDNDLPKSVELYSTLSRSTPFKPGNKIFSAIDNHYLNPYFLH